MLDLAAKNACVIYHKIRENYCLKCYKKKKIVNLENPNVLWLIEFNGKKKDFTWRKIEYYYKCNKYFI